MRVSQGKMLKHISPTFLPHTHDSISFPLPFFLPHVLVKGEKKTILLRISGSRIPSFQSSSLRIHTRSFAFFPILFCLSYSSYFLHLPLSVPFLLIPLLNLGIRFQLPGPSSSDSTSSKAILQSLSFFHALNVL